MFENLTKGPRPWKALLFSAFIGLLFLIVNFPKFLTKLIQSSTKTPKLQAALLFPIATVQKYLLLLIGPTPENTFQQLMTYDFVILWIFLTVLIVFSLRHLDVRVVVFGLGGIILGYLALHLISWLAVIIVAIITFIVKATIWIGHIITLLIEFILVNGWWLLLLLAFAGLMYAFKAKLFRVFSGSLGSFAGFIYTSKAKLFKVFSGCLVISILGYLLYKLVPIVWRWFLTLIDPIIQVIKTFWHNYIAPILIVIFALLFWILKIFISVLGTLLILTTLGNLVIDQIKAAWYSSTGRKGAALGGFAIGSAIALVFLTSIAAPDVANGINVGWKHSFEVIDSFVGSNIASVVVGEPTNLFLQTMPNTVKAFVFEYLTNVQPPIVDSVLFLGIISIATFSMFLRLFPTLSKAQIGVPVSFLPREYFSIFGGLLMSVVIIFLQAMSEGES